jgi:uncharacterized protein involved in tellurium resistance
MNSNKCPSELSESEENKKFCCGAIMRLKEKCLRFHNNDVEKCQPYIEGHEECKIVKREYERPWREQQQQQEA